ncbi:PKD domain-containing protein [Kitasatospora sp. NPDC086009]|uniref:PKD domain-containing protein n=1 Tax=unclassified Kitasatospora TaxID=2633591 RepID=UPI0037CC2CD6
MPIRRRVGLAVAVASSAVAGAVLPPLAHADSADSGVLYVDNASHANCSDTGVGTSAQPYCTIQAAADAAQPGQTVRIAPGRGSYEEQVTVRRSGLPGKPITFSGELVYLSGTVPVGVRSWSAGTQPAPHGFVLAGVHDVTVTGLGIGGPQEGVLVQDSERIVLDRNSVAAGNPVSNGVRAYPNAAPGVRIVGRSTAVTLSRNVISDVGTAGVAVDAGVTGTVITTNQVTNNPAEGVLITDAPGTVVVSNTFAQNCGSDLSLAGNSSGATVENNIISKLPAFSCANGLQSPYANLTVSAGSTAGTKADYNVVAPAIGGSGYSWGGATYANPYAFKATGQGAHDYGADPQLGYRASGFGVVQYAPVAAQGVTDAADESAPGMLDSDVYGRPRADHPKIADTGTGTGFVDRGAVELQDTMSASVWTTPYPRAGHPLQARIGYAYTGGWAPAGARLDFGDGSQPVWANPGTVEIDHDYPTAGPYTVTLTATSETGLTRTSVSTVNIAPAGPISARLSVAQDDNTVARIKVTDKSDGPWPVSRYTVDFGDGSAPVATDGSAPPNGLTHDYAVSGTYTVTETVTDDHGRSAGASVQQYVHGPLAGVPFTGSFAGPSTHLGLFDNGRWALSTQKSSAQAGTIWMFGSPGDVPVVGAWDNACQCRLGIYRPSTGTFALKHNDGSVSAVQFGDPGDIPAVGAWDRNGHDQLGIYRPSIGTLAVRHDDGSVTTMPFGDAGDLPVVGDWDGVGHAQFGLFRPGRNPGDPNLFILRHDDGSVSTATYGVKGDLPVVGDWLGKGRTTFGVFGPSTRLFTLSNAYAGQADVSFTIYG